MSTHKPLNGEKTHPLSPFAQSVLISLRSGPIPRSDLNPGIADRLLREGCTEIADLPSPYWTHKGKLIPHLRLIEAAAPEAAPPAQKPRRQRCPGSGKTIRLQGLQIACRKAPCPECQAVRAIAPEPDRTAVFPTHMRTTTTTKEIG